jgi:SH3-like domain-containing protein
MNSSVRSAAIITISLLALVGLSGVDAQSAKTPPYWASLAKPEAVMRVGPAKTFPANWVYLRRDLPVRVIETHPDWRKVEDPDGMTGWMHVRLLKDEKTAIVKGAKADLRDKPSKSSAMLHQLAPGVVGKISGCASGWCSFEVSGKSGYVLVSSLWGAVE